MTFLYSDFQTLKSIMYKRHSLTNLALEQTIDKILNKTKEGILSGITSTLKESHKTLDDAIPTLEQEYDKIISDGNKEAEKIAQQLVGSANLEARNKQLLVLEDAVNRVFTKALDQISDTDRSGEYANLITSLLNEATNILGTSEVVVYTNERDRDIVQTLLPTGSELSPDVIKCLGGVRVQSKDGTITFDNTLDARIERMKPLIRKEIAVKFGIS